MSYGRSVLSSSERLSQEQAWLNAPTIAEQYPRVRGLAIAMTFVDPRGAAQPSPMRQLYAPSMRALFELRCPLRDCTGGVFDLNASVRSMLTNSRLPRDGHDFCRGTRGRDECGLELKYSLAEAP